MPDGRQAFAFAPAKRQGVGLFVGVAGGTGSGKTYSALRLARGIAGPNGRIAAIDTEARRMSHYDNQFKFNVTDLTPPFRPTRFAHAAEDAEKAGYAVLVVDSFSLEWTGEGGVLEWHDELKGDDERKNMSAWIKPKVAHKAMISSFLQRRIPLVFCFRAEEKIKVGAGGRPEPLGWMPIGDPRFMFELTTMLTLSNEAPGRVSYKLPRKIQEQHLSFFPDGQFITEKAGEMLAAWARGEDVGKPAEPTRWQWLAAKAPVYYRSADEWQAQVCKNVGAIKDEARLREALARNVANLNGMMAEFPDEAAAIFRAFSDRGIMAETPAQQDAGLPL